MTMPLILAMQSTTTLPDGVVIAVNQFGWVRSDARLD